MSRHRNLMVLILILAAGLALRLGYLQERRSAPDFTQPVADAALHDYWARGLATGDWTPPAGEQDPEISSVPFLRPPGYPYVLAAVYRLAGTGPVASRVFQIALGLLNVVLVFALGRALFRPSVGLIAATLAALHWSGIYWESELQAVTLARTLVLGSLLALHFATHRRRMLPVIIAGLLLGLLALVRPNGLLLLPVAAVALFWLDRRPVRGIVLLVAAAVAIAPATIRNWRVAHDPVLISANGAVNLWIGNHDGADGVSAELPELEQLTGRTGWSWFSYREVVAGVAAREGREMSYSDVSHYFSLRAREWISTHPGEFLRLSGKRLLYLLGPDEISNNKAIRFEKASSRYLAPSPGFALPFALALVGVFLIGADVRRRGRGRPSDVALENPAAAWLVGLFFLVWIGSFVPFLAASRFRAPVEPLLFLFAAFAVARVAEALRRREWGVAGGLVAAALALFFLTTRSAYDSAVDEAWWHTDRGLALQRAGRTDEAEVELKAAIAANPGYVDAHVALGELYEQLDRKDEAIAHYAAVLQQRPDKSSLMMKTAVLLNARGRYQEAVPYLRTLVQISDSPETRFEYGRALTEVGRYDEGIEQFRAAIAAQPEQPQAFTNLGIAQAKLGKTSEAIESFREAIYLDPYGKEAYFHLGNALQAAKQYDDAKEAFEEAARIGLTWVDPRVHRGNLANELGEYEDAVQWYEQAIRLNPTHVVARYNMSAALANLGRFDEALEHLQVAEAQEPANRLVKERIAQIHQLMQSKAGK
ncbi:MAG: tetratricopeptide repeat protein [Gemmatimonadetes bacterium]|nr:tetratricopeptide repeat protein [Gemmatimonadota bacterium]